MTASIDAAYMEEVHPKGCTKPPSHVHMKVSSQRISRLITNFFIANVAFDFCVYIAVTEGDTQVDG